jgi:hypothetical protein
MPHPDRRSFLAALSAALLTLGAPVMAETPEIRGVVAFAGDEPIPQGALRIHLDVAGSDAARPTPSADLVADGKSTALEFTLARPASAQVLQVVARLEREDGFLLARGSAAVEPGRPVRIVLRAVMY